MIARRLPGLSALLVALSAVAAAASDPVAETACLDAAAQRAAVETGTARRFATLGRTLDGDVLRADLCRADAGLVYRVVVIDDGGRVRHLRLDAASGRLLYDGR